MAMDLDWDGLEMGWEYGMGRVNAESWTSQIKKVDTGSGDPLLVLLDFHLFKWSYNIYCWTAWFSNISKRRLVQIPFCVSVVTLCKKKRKHRWKEERGGRWREVEGRWKGRERWKVDGGGV